MNKKIIFSLFFVSILFIISASLNINQLTQNKKIVKEKIAIEKNYKQLNKENKDLGAELLSKEKTIEKLKIRENNDTNTKDIYRLYNETVEKVFNGLYNFNPDNFSTRKEEVKPYLTTEIFNQYFNNKNSVGDSNGVTSKLISSDIYVKAVQSQDLTGIVYVLSESKINGSSPKKIENGFEVKFNTTDNKITSIKNLGRIYNEKTTE